MSEKLSKNVDSIERIKFLIEYDVMKTLYENILLEQSTDFQKLAIEKGFGPVSLVKAEELYKQGKLGVEQPTDLQKLAKEKGFGPVSFSKAQELYNQGKLGNKFDPIGNQARVLASRDPAVQKAKQERYGTIDLPSTDVSRIYSRDNTLTKLDAHDWFTMFQLLMIGGAFMSGGVTGFLLFLVAGIAELAEAYYFLKVDKDPYMAVIMAIFAVIPDGGLLEIPGLSKIIQKRGVEGIKQLVRKNKQGLPLTPDEIIDLNFFNEQILINKKRLQVLFRNQLKNKLKLYIAGKSPKWIMNFLLMIRPIKEPIKIVGSLVTFDYLYAYIFRDDIEKMQIRNKNVLSNMARYVKDLLSGKIPLAEDLLVEVDEGLDETFDKIEKGEMNYDGFSMPNEEPQFDKIIK